VSALLRQITGWQPRKYSDEYSDPLAYNKFVVFALVSSLVVPKAAKSFRRALRWDKNKRRIQSCPERNLSRALNEFRSGERRVRRLFDSFLDVWWFPDATAKNISNSRPPFHPPHWHGDERPYGARTVRLRSRFPSAGYLTRLVSKFGYEDSAAIAALSRAHEPWTRVSDRRHANGGPDFNADAQIIRQVHEHSSFTPAHPYYPMSPSRRTRVGGGLTEEQVQKGLKKMRTDDKTKKALLEIVYRRRSTLQVADEFDRPAETLYRYATRLRGHIRRADTAADLSA